MTEKIEKYKRIIKCPVCSGTIAYIEKKKIIGKIQKYVCQNNECSTQLVVKKDGILLNFTKKSDNELWKKYHHKKLTLREWNNIAEGGISDKEKEEKAKMAVLEQLRTGELVLQLTDEVPIILKKNEAPCLMLPNIQLHEDRMVRQRYGGAVRLMKGVYVGTSRGESHPERRHVDTGDLILTDKRLVFVGSRKSADIDLRKILSIEPYSDGIALSRSNKKNVEWFIGNLNAASITMKIEDRDYDLRFDGLVLKCMIEGFASKLD